MLDSSRDWMEIDVSLVRHYPQKDGRVTHEVLIEDYFDDISIVLDGNDFDGEHGGWSVDIPFPVQIKAAKKGLAYFIQELKAVGFTDFVWEDAETPV